MDDLAKHSGISKKTIYQYFADKEVLVNAIVNELIELHERRITKFQTIAKYAIDEVVTLDTELLGIWTDIRNRFFYEVEKSFPEVWLELE